MNVTLASRPDPSPQPSLFQPRHDDASSAVVERGIKVQSSFNTVCAIEYMKSHNVHPRVIERVLLHPEQRRQAQH